MGDQNLPISWNGNSASPWAIPFGLKGDASTEASNSSAVPEIKCPYAPASEPSSMSLPLVTKNDAPVDSVTILPDRTNLPRPQGTDETRRKLKLFQKRRINGHIIGQKNMELFYNTLEAQKESLKKDLNLSEEDYERLVNIALGIAEQETHFGDKTYIDQNGHETWQKRLVVKDIISNLPINTSRGLTQIIYGPNFPDGSKNKETAEKYGIYSDNDFKDNPSKCAIATMIILAGHLRTAQSEKWQKRIADNNLQIEAKKEELMKANPDIDIEREKIRTDDVIAILWNGAGAIVDRFKDEDDTLLISDKNTESNFLIQLHLKSKNGMSYARYVRYYRENYFDGTIR